MGGRPKKPILPYKVEDMALEKAQIVAQTIAAVKLAQAKASSAILGIPIVEFLTVGLIPAVYAKLKETVSGFSPSSETEQLSAQAQRVDSWILMVPKALDGTQEVNGSLYTLERWVRAGQALADISNSMSGEAFDNSFFSQAIEDAKTAYVTTKDSLKTIASPTEWPWYIQAAVAGVGIFYASQIYKNFKGGK